MFFQGGISTQKTDALINEYVKLINSGISASKILVILQNSNRRQYFSNKVFEKINVSAIEKPQIYSFYGLIYNAVKDNWAKLENILPESNYTKILPNLVGLEVSQYLFRQIISQIKFEGYNSKKSLLHQLFRRYSLIVQNNLTDEDVKWRCEEVLKESFAPDAKLALDKFKKETINMRAFDYLRQSLIFSYIYQNTDYFKDIEYFILDDGDEITPACFDFIKHIKPQLKNFFIAFDPLGSSRSGYLGADKNNCDNLKALFNGEIQILKEESKMANNAKILYENITDKKNENLKRFSLTSLSKRANMIDCCINKITELLNKGFLPNQIVIVTPIVDNMLKFCLKEKLKNKLEILSLSGSEKLSQNEIVSTTICILKLANNIPVSQFDIRNILHFLDIPLKYCQNILTKFETTQKLINFEFNNEEYTKKYEKLLEVIKDISQNNNYLSYQIYKIYESLVDISKYTSDEITKFNFFIKEIKDFEQVFENSIPKEKIIEQVENSIISENPNTQLEIKEQELVIATPQKIIDNQISSKFQIWLDISSDEWIKCDTGPLYNAWVMQKNWEKPEFTLQDNLELTENKTARVLRKLTLCATENIFAYASLFDGSGVENFGGIEKYLPQKTKENIVINKKPFTPREDQKPVLEYKKGKMAISAVPGAGKTTILLELIIQLLKNKIKPENIFVLTYMESAARNFRERIQNANPDLTQLPNISTIHGLALKILKENENYEKVGLNPNFEICDDSQRVTLIKNIGDKLHLAQKDMNDFEKGVSVLKMNNQNSLGKAIEITNIKNKKLTKFVEFFNEYQKTLLEQNLIDYDDMLILSVKLLKNNPDIRSHYKDICEYIIEDEAQDSSAIQQELIEILSSKHKNLVRCGDINQAITTTFSNADVEGFRNFIKTSAKCVSMNQSQRCTKDVWSLANKLVEYTKDKDSTKNAFFDIQMKPVAGKNPEEKNAIKCLATQNTFAEKNYISKTIKDILVKNPDATIGILLRNNFQVNHWTTTIGNVGLKTITRSECLGQKAVYRVIYAILKIILNPFDNNNIAENYNTLAEFGLVKSNLFEKIKNFKTTFVSADVDEIEDVALGNFYWEIIYWLHFATLPVEELAIKIGLHYFKTEVEKSNVYLISTLIKRLNAKNLKEYLEKLDTLAKKNNLSGFKFFSEEEKSDKDILKGKVQIMTLHKSKGDEFDYVFMPEMTENSLPLKIENVKLLENTKFMENIKGLSSEYKVKTEEEMKKFILEENLRLMYVAVTRAKRKLFISYSKTSKKSEVPTQNTIAEIAGGAR
ncbi:MAG: ATP-dependent helicase [bacterium]|nr:ATP-dependent helicase [bacterium]